VSAPESITPAGIKTVFLRVPQNVTTAPNAPRRRCYDLDRVTLSVVLMTSPGRVAVLGWHVLYNPDKTDDICL